MLPAPWLDLITQHHGDTARRIIDQVETIEAQITLRESAGLTIFPPAELRYRALDMVSPDQCRVALFGQDPYHKLTRVGDSLVPQAVGLSFAVPAGAKLPPSLRNIFKELAADLGGNIRGNGDGDLTPWAQQGVLLLNTLLSVEQGQAGAHEKLGWQLVTQAIISALSHRHPDVVFVLWGNHAKGLKDYLAPNAFVIESSHPSPIGGSCNKGFFGSRPFSRANAQLAQLGHPEIRWS